MAGIVQVVLSDNDLDRLLTWAHAQQFHHPWSRSDELLHERLVNYRKALDCKCREDGASCEV